MKVVISIPDDVSADAERLARRLKKSRSRLYSDAVREYVARHSRDRVTERLDDVVSEVGSSVDGFASAAGRRRVGRVES